MATLLSKNFSLEELIASSTAAKYKIPNIPTPAVKENLKRLAVEVLQPIRDAYGKSIHISSGYRGPAVNAKVGGAKTSQHLTGSAADIYCTATSKAELFNVIKKLIETKKIKVGQLIWEYGTKKEPNWIHVSLPYTKVNQIIYLYSK